MRKYRFYCQNITGDTATLDVIETHHLAHVLRLNPGEQVEIFDGEGTVAVAVIEQIERKSASLRIIEKTLHKPRTDRRITIAAAVAKGQRFETLLIQCTELGIDHVIPTVYERTVKLVQGQSALKRYHSQAVSAAKQSHRVFLPQISEPTAFPDALALADAIYPEAAILYGSIDESAGTIKEIEKLTGDVAVFIGPEGGFSEFEIQLFSEKNALPIRLTHTVLRVETAAVAFASVLASTRDAAGN